jgi:alpha-mannosidase
MPENKKKQRLHMIGNAHIDPVWLWQWPDGFQEIKATFRSALDRMNEYDDFVFTSSSVSYYEWVEQNDLAMFAEIKARVAEGRWVISGGWWVQPDCNLPCGESFVRQGLYGQRYLREKLGTVSRTGYNVDSFGHNAMLPQILKKSGMDSYMFMRPGPHEKGLPGSVFLWKAGDGSAIKACRIPYEYCSWGKELDGHVRRCAKDIKGLNDDFVCFYGVGNHGGGPTKENLESIHRLNRDSTLPELVLSSPEQFFAAIDPDSLPQVSGDLLHHASGCYAVHSGIKMLNRKAENRLMAAEKLGVMAKLTAGHQCNTVSLQRAWKNVLFNQFHDILAGTSIEEAYEDARDSYGEALHLAMQHLNDAAQSMSWNIDIEQDEGMIPIVVFNPCGFENRTAVEIESKNIPEGYALFDSRNKEIPFQKVHSSATANGRCKVCFVAQLPSMGYALFRLRKVEKAESFADVPCTDNVLENSTLRVEIDHETGYMKSLYKKDTGMELLYAPGAVPVVLTDKSDTWSHNVRRYENVAGVFTARRISVLEQGPVKSVLRVVSEYQRSRLIQDIEVYQDLPYVEIRVTVDWREQFSVLKLKFPMNLVFRAGNAEIPYGYMEREMDGEEYPMQSWIDVTGGLPGRDQEIVGMSFLNDGKTSYSICNREVSITVLRSPIYAHHDPLKPDPESEYSFIDQGIQRFTYRLYPHNGGFEQSGVPAQAISLNQRPFALFETYHKGTLPVTDSVASVDNGAVILSVLKFAEDGTGMVLRLYETTGCPAHAKIFLPKLDRVVEADFGPMEIKTILVPFDGAQQAKEANLLEDVQ